MVFFVVDIASSLFPSRGNIYEYSIQWFMRLLFHIYFTRILIVLRERKLYPFQAHHQFCRMPYSALGFNVIHKHFFLFSRTLNTISSLIKSNLSVFHSFLPFFFTSFYHTNLKLVICICCCKQIHLIKSAFDLLFVLFQQHKFLFAHPLHSYFGFLFLLFININTKDFYFVTQFFSVLAAALNFFFFFFILS